MKKTERRTRGTRKARISRNVKLIALAVIAFIIVLIVASIWKRCDALNEKYSDQYTTEVLTGNFTIIIDGDVNVRTEPLAALHHNVHGLPAGYMNEHFSVNTESVNNCIGETVDRNGTGIVFEVEHIVRVRLSSFDDCVRGDDWNGPFVGFVVSELDENELKALPSAVKKDKDGIIWISQKYLSIFED